MYCKGHTVSKGKSWEDRQKNKEEMSTWLVEQDPLLLLARRGWGGEGFEGEQRPEKRAVADPHCKWPHDNQLITN